MPLILASGCLHASHGSKAPVSADADRIVPIGELRTECGRLEDSPGGEIAIRSPCLRAVRREGTDRDAEVDFRYLGPTQASEPLASGELRRQIGLKLRARDTCNVVYVMWHIEPRGGVHVSVKSNPGRREHSQCHDGGYLNVSPTRARAVRPIVPGERRKLRAFLAGDTLTVEVDSEPVWTGTLPGQAFAVDGPMGVRTDNGEFDLVMRVRSALP
jgi:hypothetical protein